MTSVNGAVHNTRYTAPKMRAVASFMTDVAEPLLLKCMQHLAIRRPDDPTKAMISVLSAPAGKPLGKEVDLDASAQYFKEHVDPIVTDLVRKLIVSEPTDVAGFMVEELKKRDAGAGAGAGASAGAGESKASPDKMPIPTKPAGRPAARPASRPSSRPTSRGARLAGAYLSITVERTEGGTRIVAFDHRRHYETRLVVPPGDTYLSKYTDAQLENTAFVTENVMPCLKAEPGPDGRVLLTWAPPGSKPAEPLNIPKKGQKGVLVSNVYLIITYEALATGAVFHCYDPKSSLSTTVTAPWSDKALEGGDGKNASQFIKLVSKRMSAKLDGTSLVIDFKA